MKPKNIAQKSTDTISDINCKIDPCSMNFTKVRTTVNGEELITIAATERVEIIMVKITLNCYNIYICCIYVPSATITYEMCNVSFGLFFATTIINSKVFILGDFN